MDAEDKGVVDKGTAEVVEGAAVAMGVQANEQAEAEGHYVVQCVGPREELRAAYCALRDHALSLMPASRWTRVKLWLMGTSVAQEIMRAHAIMETMVENKWADEIRNVVCTDGKNGAFQAIFKASAFTSTVYMGLIGNVTYSVPAVGGTAAAIATSASANNWNEAAAATCAARQAPSFAAPSAGAVALSAARSFSILAADTINGCFVLIASVALVAPVATVGSTAGALWSAGAFTGGAKAVANGDTLNVSYTTSM